MTLTETINNNKTLAHPTVKLTITNYGEIEMELYQDVAYNTVANFISLAKSGYYNGIIFHRVIEGFMIQGGDPTGTGCGGPGYAIKGEFAANGVENNISHVPGVVSMARTSYPDSAGSQFFICAADCTFLDKQYAAFGKVTSGLDVVYEISRTRTIANDKPTRDVVIESVTVDEKGGDYSYVEKFEE